MDLSELSDETLIALCGILLGAFAILGGISVAITLVVSNHYRRKMRDDIEATLKMEMIQRGMSADEITKVLGARTASNGTSMNEWMERVRQMRGPAGRERKCGSA